MTSTEEYRELINEIPSLNTHNDGQKLLRVAMLMAQVLVDIREKLFNPDMKETK